MAVTFDANGVYVSTYWFGFLLVGWGLVLAWVILCVRDARRARKAAAREHQGPVQPGGWSRSNYG